MSNRAIRITVSMILVIIGILLLVNLIPLPGFSGVITHTAYPPPLTPTNLGPYPPSDSAQLLSTPTTHPDNASPDDSALILDAQMYATDQNVSLEEALRRLKIQYAVGELNAELTQKEKATFCGLWIQHKPDFRVNICGSTVFNGINTQIWGVCGCKAPAHTPNLGNFPLKPEEPYFFYT